nr:MAG TPA: hypothetical protein [Caudoviricetes sp.]
MSSSSWRVATLFYFICSSLILIILYLILY